MMTLGDILDTFDLESGELDVWISAQWVRPERRDGDYVFTEVDVARVRLISEIRYDMGVDADAMPVVLSLLDQVYDLRRQLKCLGQAVAAQPEDVSRDIFERVRRLQTAQER